MPERHRGRADTLRVVGIHQPGEARAETLGRQITRSVGSSRSSKSISALGDAAQTHGRLPRPDPQPRVSIAHGDEAADAQLDVPSKTRAKIEMQLRDAAAGDPVLLPFRISTCRLAFRRGSSSRLAALPASGSVMQMAGLSPASTTRRPSLRCLGAVFHDGDDRAHVAFHRDAPGDAADLGHLLDHQYGIENVRPCPPSSLGTVMPMNPASFSAAHCPMDTVRCGRPRRRGGRLRFPQDHGREPGMHAGRRSVRTWINLPCDIPERQRIRHSECNGKTLARHRPSVRTADCLFQQDIRDFLELRAGPQQVEPL